MDLALKVGRVAMAVGEGRAPSDTVATNSVL
jgi:hypothetical protein